MTQIHRLNVYGLHLKSHCGSSKCKILADMFVDNIGSHLITRYIPMSISRLIKLIRLR